MGIGPALTVTRSIGQRQKLTRTNEKRLVKAKQCAGLLSSDLREILTHTDNLALDEIMLEAIQEVEKIRRRLKRFALYGSQRDYPPVPASRPAAISEANGD